MNLISNNPIYYSYYTSPIGKLLIVVENDSLILINFEKEQTIELPNHFQQVKTENTESWAVFCKTREVLDRYFSGEAIDFSKLDFIQPKGTDFQRSVWKVLTQIPYGKTTSYGEIA
ncbi:MGMT family protein, partial [Otariodibacter sp.]|uniref:methylated-DNA--[protein]-cysteine S-methyltransferase n=1 Tax=Otariodibacter sp. TaxID=3030919 RepID=UPI00262239C0